MPATTQDQADTIYTEPAPLIDIFYKDNGRIYSLISQIERGAWQERTVTQEKKQKSELTNKANIGATRALGSEFSTSEGEDITRNIQTKTAPFDDIVLSLLKALKITPKIIPPHKVFSQIDILKGSIRLQNFKMVSNIFPILKQNPKMFIEELQTLDVLIPKIQELKKKSIKLRMKTACFMPWKSKRTNCKKSARNNRISLKWCPLCINFSLQESDLNYPWIMGQYFLGS